MLRSKWILGSSIGVLVLATICLGLYRLSNTQNGTNKLTIAAGEKGGDTYEFAEALEQIIEEVEPTIDLQLIETQEAVDTIKRVQSGEAALGLFQIDQESQSRDCNLSQPCNPSQSQINLVALIYPEVFHLVVQSDSDIKSPADLKGKVVASSETIFPFVLQYYDLSANEVEVRNLSGDEALEAFLKHEVDAVFRWSEPGTTRVEDLVQQGNGRLIPFDQYESMRLSAPYLAEFTLPRGIYQAGNPVVPAGELKTVRSYKALVANAHANPDLIRIITRVLFEQQNTLVTQFPLSVYLRSPLTTQMIGPSVHPGAQAYYDKDKPSFFQQYAPEISFVFAAGPLLASIFWALWGRLPNKQQNRAKLHFDAVYNALIRLSEARDSQTAEVVEKRLLKILAQFTKDLHDGNIDSNDAHTFSLVWDKAVTMIRHRMRAAN